MSRKRFIPQDSDDSEYSDDFSENLNSCDDSESYFEPDGCDDGLDSSQNEDSGDDEDFSFMDEANYLGNELQISKEDIAASMGFLKSDIGKQFIYTLKKASLTFECKAAFARVVVSYYSQDVFLSTIHSLPSSQLNLSLDKALVKISACSHDVKQPVYLQLCSLLTNTIPYICSRAISGRERSMQGVTRIENTSGEAGNYLQQQPAPAPKRRRGLFWRD